MTNYTKNSQYVRLSNYQDGNSSSFRTIRGPAPRANGGGYYGAPVAAPGTYVVPNYSAPGYDALTHGGNTNGVGYFKVTAAYGADSSSCSNMSYASRPCSSVVN